MENSEEGNQKIIQDIIEATSEMDALEYLEFMELTGPERIKKSRGNP